MNQRNVVDEVAGRTRGSTRSTDETFKNVSNFTNKFIYRKMVFAVLDILIVFRFFFHKHFSYKNCGYIWII